MARVSVTIYKNSFLASIVSILGTGVALCGLMALLSREIAVGIVAILLGFGLMVLASSISDRKAFRTWLKEAKKKTDIDGMIRASVSSAIAVYNLYPGTYMLSYVSNLNPEAGRQIRQYLADQKAAQKKKK